MAPISVMPVLRAPRVEPEAGHGIRQYPHDFRMNPLQNVVCALGGSISGVVIGRPVYQLQHFYFLSTTPDKLSVPQKNVMFWKALRTTRWFSGSQPLWLEVGAYAGLYCVYYAIDEFFFGRVPTSLRGFVSGAFTGVVVAAIRHPYDVLRATAEKPGPKQFTGALDVLVTSIRHKPSALLGIYKGGGMAAFASVLQYSTMFGIWDMTKDYAVTGHDVSVFIAAYCAVVSGYAAQYPFHYIKQVIHDLNKTKRFGGFSPNSYVKEMRRTRGITIIWTGFFRTRPLIGSVGTALTLMGYDHIKRWFHAQLNRRS